MRSLGYLVCNIPGRCFTANQPINAANTRLMNATDEKTGASTEVVGDAVSDNGDSVVGASDGT